MEVTHGVHQLRLHVPEVHSRDVNCYLIEGTTGWLMVDSGWGTQSAFDQLCTLLRDAHLALTDISTIVCTHLHPDHFGLASRIVQESPNTKILVHRWEWTIHDPRHGAPAEFADEVAARWLANGVPPAEVEPMHLGAYVVFHPMPVELPVKVLYGGEIINTGKHYLEVIWTPGHSPGHVCLYEREAGWLFSGDHILPKAVSTVGFHGQCGDDPLGNHIRSLRKLASLPVSIVFPSHGVCFTGLANRVEQIVEHHDKRQREVLQVLGKKPANAYEITRQLSLKEQGEGWKHFSPFHQGNCVAETLVLLQWMRWNGKVEQLTCDGSVVFQTATNRE